VSTSAINYQKQLRDAQYKTNLQDWARQWARTNEQWESIRKGSGKWDEIFKKEYESGDAWEPFAKNEDGTQKDGTDGEQWRLFQFQEETVNLQKKNAAAQRQYQIDTAVKNYEYGLAIADYEFEQQKKFVAKRDEEVDAQLQLNQSGMEFALDRERKVLDEQFIQAAFDNTNIIQDLYEATGAAGFDKAEMKLGLKNTEGELESIKAKSLANVKQQIENSQFATAGKQLELIDQAGKASYTKAGLSQSLRAKEAQSKYDQYVLGLDVFGAKTRADFENDMLMRQIDDQKAKAAFDTTEANVKALQAAGQAQLGQAGRSQGKAIQAFFAELGRQNAMLVETLVRGKSAGDARAVQNLIGSLDTESRAMVASDKIDLQTLDNIATTNREMSEVDRGLSMTGQQGQLDLQAIRKEMEDLLENTDIDFKEINRNLRTAQIDTALGMEKADWSLDNIGAKFRTNQAILKAQLDSAVENSVANQKDIVLSKLGSDLQAEAQRMLEATRPTDAEGNLILPPDPSLDANQPPMIEYQDPMEPTPPPLPTIGATPSGNNASNIAAQALGSASTGLAVYSGLKAAGFGVANATTGIGAVAAWPFAVAAALGTYLLSD
jgi:hypothetical protein